MKTEKNSDMWFTPIYRAFLCLFPHRFRDQFGEEMISVFTQAACDAASGGLFSLAKTLTWEFTHLPIEASRQRIHAYRSTPLPTSANPIEKQGPPSWKEGLAALAVFVLPAAYILINNPLNLSARTLGVLISVFILVVFFTGLLKGFPRWSLPYLGLALSLVSFLFVFQWGAGLVAPAFLSRLGLHPQDGGTRLLLQSAFAGLLWLSLFILILLTLWILSWLRGFQPLLHRIRRDWTLVSYILYYGAALILFLLLDTEKANAPSALAYGLCLACGAWLYLHSRGHWGRILALFGGLSLALTTAVAAHWPLGLMPGWQTWVVISPTSSFTWQDIRWTVLNWVWLSTLLLVPAFIKIKPKRDLIIKRGVF